MSKNVLKGLVELLLLLCNTAIGYVSSHYNWSDVKVVEGIVIETIVDLLD